MAAERVKGFVDAVEPFQMRGWAFDATQPQARLRVEIVVDGAVVAVTVAELFRQDLAENGIGDGDHAFICNFPRQLEPRQLATATARVVWPDGARHTLPGLAAPPPPPPDQALPRLAFEGWREDAEARPVFVLGAARSGTSAMAMALLGHGGFSGHREGHLLDLMAHWSVSLNRFYTEKADEAAGERDTLVARVPREFFHDAFGDLIVRAMRSLFPDGRWLDKTPNSNMIHLAPRLRQLWPNARFVFMKRRFLENAQSRARKFPAYGFRQNCAEWANCMAAWLQVRGQLAGAALEVDQRALDAQPGAVAEAVRDLLGLDEATARRVAQAFAHDRPERTSDAPGEACDLERLGWAAEDRQTYEELCAPLMRAYGYAADAGYWLAGQEASGLARQG